MIYSFFNFHISWGKNNLKAVERLFFALRKGAGANQSRKSVKHKDKAPGVALENHNGDILEAV